MSEGLTRRQALGVGLAATALPAAVEAQEKKDMPFVFCLNTSTIRGQKLPLAKVIDIAVKAGYGAVEPWLDEMERHVSDGSSLKDLGKRIADAGLVVADAIAFPQWVVDDAAARQKGLEEARRAMGLVQQIGGTRIAAPPAGATNKPGLDLRAAAERYRALLDIGDQHGVLPLVELWGHSKNISRLSEAAFVAIESGHPKASVLADIFHLHKGGSGFAGLNLLGPQALQVMHVNDYPATPGRAEITDAQRVYPGDGVAPLKQVFRDLHRLGCRTVLSLELFNRDLWQQDPAQVAKTGLEKVKAAVAAALA
jgi:sugar phosphate isomerase/epimerase